MAKNQSLPAHLQEKDSRGEDHLPCMNAMKNSPPGDQGLAFQTHALQMTLFEPFSRANPTLLRFVTDFALTIGAVCGKAHVLVLVVG